MIDERKIKILESIIDDYITTGEPVGSRTIAKKYDLGISSATIRNEMADLEELGYLEQPHTSAGRIPSSRGYRLYVDRLMQKQSLSIEEELMIKDYLLNSAIHEIDRMAKQVSLLLSELTKLTCVFKMASVGKSSIKSIQLIRVDDFNIVCVVVTDAGIIKNLVIRTRNAPKVSEINELNKVLNNSLRGLTVEQINLQVMNKIKSHLEGFDDIFNSIIKTLYEALNEREDEDVFMEGTTNIFNYPEYNDIEKAKQILSLLYNKDYVSELVNLNKGNGTEVLGEDDNIRIKIGDENFIPEAKDCSVITAVYYLDGKPIGTIGLIGPRRIDYGKVVSIMSEVMKELNLSSSEKRLR